MSLNQLKAPQGAKRVRKRVGRGQASGLGKTAGRITPLVLRHRGREYALNGLWQSIRARGAVDYFTWRFKFATAQTEIEGTLSAPAQAFVGLKYDNPPGGVKHCLNTKIAACHVQIKDRASGIQETMETGSRAAFEILTDDQTHGIPITA